MVAHVDLDQQPFMHTKWRGEGSWLTDDHPVWTYDAGCRGVGDVGSLRQAGDYVM